MTGREWKPGDVAMVVGHSGYVGKRVMRCDDGKGRVAWSLECSDGLSMAFGDQSLRPLVVIDPEDREQVERLMNTVLATINDRILTRGVSNAQAALREFANPTPAKPEEPTGLGAVVECEYDGRKGTAVAVSPRQWVFRGDHFTNHSPYWDDFENVRVLSEGVTQ